MSVFEHLNGEYEEVVFFHDPPTGLRAIVAIHSTTLGPALGGTRFYPFGSEDEALRDVLRLARGMTYKAAAAGLDLGGGKAVIIGDPKRIKTEELLRAYGRFIETLGGRYITAEDIGTNREDMDMVRRETRYVTGISPELGGSGDPSPVTAYGTFLGMRACAEEAWGEHCAGGPDRRGAGRGQGRVPPGEAPRRGGRQGDRVRRRRGRGGPGGPGLRRRDRRAGQDPRRRVRHLRARARWAA